MDEKNTPNWVNGGFISPELENMNEIRRIANSLERIADILDWIVPYFDERTVHSPSERWKKPR